MRFPGEMSTVLIVEDNVPFREIIKNTLKSHFPWAIIYEAGEGNAALQIVDTHDPELVFMDIRLPGENGLVLTKKIKGLHPRTPVIILTGCDAVEYREAATQSGANCFMTKDSMNWQQIETCVRSVLQAQ